MTIPNPTQETVRQQLLAEIQAFTEVDPATLVLEAEQRLGDLYNMAMNSGSTEIAQSIATVYSQVQDMNAYTARAVDFAVIAREMLQTVSDQLTAETQARTVASTELNNIHADLESPWYAAQTATVALYVERVQQDIEVEMMEYFYDSERVDENNIERLLSDGLPALEPAEGEIFYSFLMGDMLDQYRQLSYDLRDELTALAKRIAATLYNRGLLDMAAKESYYVEMLEELEGADTDQDDAA